MLTQLLRACPHEVSLTAVKACAGVQAGRSAGAETHSRLVEKREAEDEMRENAMVNEIDIQEGAEEERVAAADETPDLGAFNMSAASESSLFTSLAKKLCEHHNVLSTVYMFGIVQS